MTTIGYRYNDTADNADVTDIAKAMRADIKAAVRAGLLPAGKYQVRTHRYAGGQSIDIAATIPGAWIDCQGQRYYTAVDGVPRMDTCTYCEDFPWQSHRSLTEDAAVALMTLERIHGAYNYDNSDTITDYFDRRYYGTVQVTE